MKPHVFTIEGMTFVSGLFWYPLAGITQAERLREIKSLAKEQDFDLYILRQASIHYVGFIHSDGILKSGISSAAAVVSKTLEMESQAREFIFVSALPDGTWIYVAQRDGIILPDGDKNFTTEDAAKSRLLEDISLGDWSLVFAPDIWGIDRSIERDFMSFLPDSESGAKRAYKWWKLNRVNPYDQFVSVSKYAFVLLLVAGLGLSGWWLYKVQTGRQDEIPDLSLQKPPPPPPPEHPWKNMPQAEDLVYSCLRGISEINLFPGNWKISSVRCQHGMIQISWEAGPFGWIDHIKAVMPDASISQDGKIATKSVQLPLLIIGKDESVNVKEKEIMRFQAAAQRYGFNISLTPVSPQQLQPVPADQAAQNIPLPDWSEITWSVRETEHPELVVQVLDGNGFRMNSMGGTWKDGRFLWDVEGTHYVMP